MAEVKTENANTIRDPDYVSPEGCPWWLDKKATDYARVLPGHTVWLTRDMNQQFWFMLMLGPTPQYQAAEIDDMGKEIDRRAFLALNGTRKH